MKARGSSYIKRMLLSYLPILFVTVSMLIFIFMSIINGIYGRNAMQANRVTAAFIVNTVDSTLKGILMDTQKMTETDDRLRRYFEAPADRELEYDVSNLLTTIIVRYGLIDSIYVYRAKDGKVLDQSAIRPMEEFPDKAYIRSSIEQIVPSGWTSPRLKQTDGIERSASVTSLVLKVPRDSGSLGLVTVNIKISALESFIRQMINEDVAQAQVTDAQGRAFFTERGGIAHNGLNADKLSEYTNWKYTISIKNGKWLDYLFHGNTVWLALGVLSIVFAISSTLYVTRRSYKPIEAILHRIDRFSSIVRPGETKVSKNEFAFIDQAIERLITNNMDFQEKQQEHLVIRRQQFLQMLLKGDYEEERALWEQEWQHFGLAEGQYIVALLELDHYVQFGLKYNPSDQSLFKFIISSVAVEVAEQNGQRVVSEWISKNQFILLLISRDGAGLEHHILQIAEQIRAWVERYLDFTVTIGIGLAAGSEEAISRSFHEAMAAVSRKVTLGVNRIIHTVEAKDKTDSEWFAYLEMIRTIVRKIRMLETEWIGELELLFNEMAVHQLRKEDVERLLNYLVFQLEFELEGTLPGEAKTWFLEAKPELLLALKQADTLKQLEGCFTATLRRIAGHVEDLAQSRRHITLMKEVRDYVAAHYTDPNLSLTMLSDRFQINGKYLSQLFKESIGQNFLDFLIGLRIERAKQLLLESDQSVQDISEAVGYLNTTSFIRVFRKTVGMSPGQYRESRPRGQEPG